MLKDTQTPRYAQRRTHRTYTAQFKAELAPERLQARQQHSRPILDALHEWMVLQRQQVAGNSATAKALDYSLKRWTALTRFVDDPQLPVDNNWVENQIRPIALGRSNWLFAGSLRAGQRAAAVMSLIQSARMNGHDPYAYLKDVLTRLMALWRRRPKDTVLVHSDQGCQFTGHDWQGFLREHNLVSSMSRRGNCHDNAVAESFFQLLKRERIRRQIYPTRQDARADVFSYIEMFYNPKRRHNTSGGVSPVEFEKRQSQQLGSV